MLNFKNDDLTQVPFVINFCTVLYKLDKNLFFLSNIPILSSLIYSDISKHWYCFYQIIIFDDDDDDDDELFLFFVDELFFWHVTSRVWSYTEFRLRTVSSELWAWTLIYTSWTFQYVSEIVLFSRLLEGFISGPCI